LELTVNYRPGVENSKRLLFLRFWTRKGSKRVIEMTAHGMIFLCTTFPEVTLRH
jgi:hypothetical protein